MLDILVEAAPGAMPAASGAAPSPSEGGKGSY
jgi:hypothetical protein